MTKSIPFGLLAFAVSSSLMLAQEGSKPAAAGWSAKPGSGLKYDGGDAFGLSWSNLLQVHWTYANLEPLNGSRASDTNTFNIRRARTTLSGHAFSKNILYKFQLDGLDDGTSSLNTSGTTPTLSTSSNPALKDGFVTWNFSSSESGTLGLRVGQGKTQFGLEANGSSASLWFVERSSASRAFADSRSRGAWLLGVMMDKKLRYTLGAMNSDVAAGLGGAVNSNLTATPPVPAATGYTDRGEEAANSDNELSYVLSANFDPLGDFFGGKQTTEGNRQGDWRTDETSLKGTIGIGVALGNGRTASSVGGARRDIESTSLNLNTAWTVSNMHVMGEYFMRTDEQQTVADEEEPTGWAVSTGYLLPKTGDSPMQWGLGLRVNRNDNDGGVSGATIDFLTGMQGIGATPGECTEVTAVVNAFYHGHTCKSQFEYTHQDVDLDVGGRGTNHIFRICFQLEF